MGVDVEVPSSREVPLSMNQGKPLVELMPKSPVVKSIDRLVSTFAEVESGRSGFLWRRVS
jgi:pilus assembly protein CpaE